MRQSQNLFWSTVAATAVFLAFAWVIAVEMYSAQAWHLDRSDVSSLLVLIFVTVASAVGLPKAYRQQRKPRPRQTTALIWASRACLAVVACLWAGALWIYGRTGWKLAPNEVVVLLMLALTTVLVGLWAVAYRRNRGADGPGGAGSHGTD